VLLLLPWRLATVIILSNGVKRFLSRLNGMPHAEEPSDDAA